ncbi:3879_t:CDS:1, partial [Scutellospora calospora]
YELKVSEQNRKTKRLIIKQFFGRVLWYFVHEHNNATVMLAYVECANVLDKKISKFGIKTFYHFGRKEFIDVQAIKRC